MINVKQLLDGYSKEYNEINNLIELIIHNSSEQ